jgi:hypothetical protein
MERIINLLLMSYVDRLSRTYLYLPRGTAAARNAVIYFALVNRELCINSVWLLVAVLYANIFMISLPIVTDLGGDELAFSGRDRL